MAAKIVEEVRSRRGRARRRAGRRAKGRGKEEGKEEGGEEEERGGRRRRGRPSSRENLVRCKLQDDHETNGEHERESSRLWREKTHDDIKDGCTGSLQFKISHWLEGSLSYSFLRTSAWELHCFSLGSYWKQAGNNLCSWDSWSKQPKSFHVLAWSIHRVYKSSSLSIELGAWNLQTVGCALLLPVVKILTASINFLPRSGVSLSIATSVVLRSWVILTISPRVDLNASLETDYFQNISFCRVFLSSGGLYHNHDF